MLILETRNDFLSQLPTNGVVAEIGVDQGDNAKNILSICKPKELHLIDAWKDNPNKSRTPQEWNKRFNNVKNIFNKNPNIHVYRADSADSASLFADNYFDWVYIDACHTYEACKKDIEAWFPKVKVGGLLCGHDYGNTPRTIRLGFGVTEAVDEFCLKNNLKIDFISNVPEHTDFAIKVL